VKGNINLV